MSVNAVLETLTIECPDCKGEGAIETPIPGGVWNRQLGGWEPDVQRRDAQQRRDAVVDLVANDPRCGVVIPGSGGIRKVRVGVGARLLVR